MTRILAARRTPLLVSAAITGLCCAATARAQGAESAPDAGGGWMSGIRLSAQIEGGVMLNPDRPADGQNFGQLFTDHANQAQLNQILLTASRATDPKAAGYDVGFKLQALYGSDARYTQFMGELNAAFATRYQLAIVEANVAAHLPWLTAGGIDAKLGQFASPLGYEVIDPAANPFYSHSYIFNFGLPFVQTGLLTITHATPVLDVYIGIDSGVNTTLFAGDNNSAAAATFGVGLNLLGGKMTVTALSHIGPENPSRTVSGANGSYRYLNDAYVTWKATDKLTLTAELNLIRDDAFHANAFGAAQYVSYALTDTLTLNGRAEVFRDDTGFFVAAYPGNHDYVNAEYGFPATVIGHGPATYGEFTLGVTYKPALPAPISTLMLRPELRYDRALTSNTSFNAGKSAGAFMIGADAVLGF